MSDDGSNEDNFDITYKCDLSDEECDEDDEFQFTVLTTNQIVVLMNRTISEVHNIVCLPKAVIRILLDHYKWNSEIMLERYYIREDLDTFFQDANLENPFKFIETNDESYEKYESKPCPICLNNKTFSEFTRLKCGHDFCGECWNAYLNVKILHEGMEEPISCIAYQCPVLIDDDICISILKNAKARQVYQNLITTNFIEFNRLTRWCPNPNCSNVIKVESVKEKAVSCSCGTTFCFSCGFDWHSPLKCNFLQKWFQKCSENEKSLKDDIASFNWFAANTKNCPKCNNSIEKNGGCNKMTCGNRSCKHEFCWICLLPWKTHIDNHYKCNRYMDKDSKQEYDKQENERNELKRYSFYYNRYLNYKTSLKLQNKLQLDINRKIEELQEQGATLHKLRWLEEAVIVLGKCRRTLLYTYVFAYYLKENTEFLIFEGNQSNLQHATETLSEYLEHELGKVEINDVKLKIVNKFRYCDKRRIVLEKHVYEGYERNAWEYRN